MSQAGDEVWNLLQMNLCDTGGSHEIAVPGIRPRRIDSFAFGHEEVPDDQSCW
jgi:hypothetical protein